MNIFRLFFFGVLLVCLVGCVSKPMETEKHAPPLMIAQNSDGQATISWESEPNRVYTIYYQAEKGGDWKALPTAYQMRGTGSALTIYDQVNPNWPIRRYRLFPEDI